MDTPIDCPCKNLPLVHIPSEAVAYNTGSYVSFFKYPGFPHTEAIKIILHWPTPCFYLCYVHKL